MRLTRPERTALLRALAPARARGLVEVRLFGSRTQPDARGGDIDLLLLVRDDAARRTLGALRPELLVALKDELGEQKFDLVIATAAQSKLDPFLRDVMRSSVSLDEP